MAEYNIRATFTVALDAIVEAETPEDAKKLAAQYISNECNFTVEQFDDFRVAQLQFDDIVVEDVNLID